MTVETGSSIADLDPNAPVDSQPVGEGNEHIQRTKLSLTYTFSGSAGDRYDETSGPVTVGPVALNRLPADVSALAAEIGLNLNSITDPTTIDDLVTNAVRRDIPETITQAWTFNGAVIFGGAPTFNAGAAFENIVPQISSVDIATVDDIPTYYERSKLQLFSVPDPTYTTQPGDWGKKLEFTNSSGCAVTILGGVNDDLLFLTNSGAGVVTVTGSVGEFFQRQNGVSTTSFTITGNWRTVGMHKVNGDWQLTGDYDL